MPTTNIILNEITLNTLAGSNVVYYHPLAFKPIIQVSRAGIIYDIVSTTPAVGSRQVKKIIGSGGFLFDAVFNTGETIMIKWKSI